MKSSAKLTNNVLFTVERRVVIGEVQDGGTYHPVYAGLAVIGEVISTAFDNAPFPARDADSFDQAEEPTITDTLTFTWQGHTVTVNVEPNAS